MKKILVLVLAMIMALSMGVAFAEEPVGPTKNANSVALNANGTTDAKVIFDKAYTTYLNGNVYPTTDDKTAPVPTGDTLTVFFTSLNEAPEITAAGSVNITATGEQCVSVNLPQYDKVGLYKYIVTESASAAGVNTSSEDGNGEITLSVLVTWNENYTGKVAQIGVEQNADGDKNDDFNNAYRLGELKIKKTVSGNLSSQTADFDMAVRLTSSKKVCTSIDVSSDGANADNNKKTVTMDEDEDGNYVQTVMIKLRHNETATFTNVPVGVMYEVVENGAHIFQGTEETKSETFDSNSAANKQYTVTYGETVKGNIVNGATGTISETASNVKVNNEKKNSGINTGMLLDNAPYMIIMALVLVGAAMMLKRRAYND